MALTRTFRVSGALSAIALLSLVLSKAQGAFGRIGLLLILCVFPVFLVSATRHLLRGLLWRVGSRLLVSYFVIGVVPIPFLAILVYLGIAFAAGQLSVRRVDADLLR